MEDRDVRYAKWLDGEISDDQLLSTDGPKVLADLKRLVKTTDEWAMPKYNTTEGYEEFKKRHSAKAVPTRKINWLWLSGIAASFLLLIFCWNTFLDDKSEILFAAYGENQMVALSDGSQIQLNDGSKVKYNLKNWKDQRSIELSGEALFEVTKGSPFVVNTQNGSIEVLGTQFNVRAWGENLYVECYEGRVQVSVDNQEVILSKGQRVNVIQGAMKEKQEINNLAPSWQNGTSRFYNEKLEVVFDEFERQYDVEVSSSVSNRSFSGNFRHDNLEGALQAICKPLGLSYRINETQKVIVIE